MCDIQGAGKMPFFDAKAQYQGIREEINSVIEEVLDSGRFILSQRLGGFEKEFAGYIGAGHGVGVGSGTDALCLVLIAAGVGRGDEVVTVPNTAVPTISAIRQCGATPVFVDVDPASLIMDPNRLEKLLRKNTGPRPKAVVPVHLYGGAADMASIMDICSKFGVKVIEDACQAHGAEYQGRKVGSIGEAGVFSFYPTKNLGAFGDGGIVVTDNGEMADRLRLLRNYGQKDRYHAVTDGFNSRLDEIQAAALSVKLKHLDQWNSRRRRLASLYDELLDPEAVLKPVEPEGVSHVYHLYVIRHKEREGLQRFLESNGVSTLIHYPVPVHLQEAYRFLGFGEGSFPEAERASSEVLSLPIYPELNEEEVEEVSRLVNSFG